VRHFETVEELRKALAAFAAEYNASWLRQRQGYKTPNQIRAEQKALEPEAATGVILGVIEDPNFDGLTSGLRAIQVSA
jgi:hypothetical protein